MKVQGRDCTLTVAKDNEYYPLPYSEETVRQTSKGYVLPGYIGIRNREKRVITGRTIQCCVVTRLEEKNVLALFLLLFYLNEKFDLLADSKMLIGSYCMYIKTVPSFLKFYIRSYYI